MIQNQKEQEENVQRERDFQVRKEKSMTHLAQTAFQIIDDISKDLFSIENTENHFVKSRIYRK